MDNLKVLLALRPNATFKDNLINGFSLKTLGATYEGSDLPTQAEMDAEGLIVEASIANDKIIEAAKTVRDKALNNLTHAFSADRIMQTRPKDESNIRNAIEIMTAGDIATIGWIMLDNTKQNVTVAELQTALTAGQMAAMQVWNDYNP